VKELAPFFPMNMFRDLLTASQHRMSSVDTSWLRMDSPHNLMMITGVIVFDTPVDRERLKQTVENRFLKFKRFRQRPVQAPAMAYWEKDPNFDIDHHVCAVVLPGKAGKAALQDFVSDLAAVPLEADRPLWRFHLIERFGKGSAMVVRIHHCYADGIALIAVMHSLTTTTSDEVDVPLKPEREEEEPGLFEQLLAPATQAYIKSVKLSGKLMVGYLNLLTHPAKAMDLTRQGVEITQEAAALLATPTDTKTRFKGIPGIVKRVAWAEPLPLDEVKAVGKALGCSVNDVLLSCVAGALRDYLVEKGDNVDGVEIRAMVPVNLRSPKDAEKLGNHFGLVALVLPVGVGNPLKRLYEVRRRMQALKGSYQPMLAYGLLAAVGMAPKMVQDLLLGSMSAKATAVMTNVPGPSEKLYLAGARIEQQMFWVPQSGNIGMGVSILSYGGGVQFGLMTDKGLVPDPEKIIDRFGAEFEKLLLLTLMEPWDEQRDPEEVEASLLMQRQAE